MLTWKSIMGICSILSMILIISFGQATGDTYRYVDVDGVILVTNGVQKPGFKQFVDEKDRYEKSNLYSYYVVIGPFKNLKVATRIHEKLNTNGVENFIYKETTGKYIVWFGNFLNREEALKKAQDLKEAKLINEFKVLPSVKYVERKKSKLTQVAQRMEISIKSKYFNKQLQPKCFIEEETGRKMIWCTLLFPGEFTTGNVPMRYVHDIQAITGNIATEFRNDKSPESFSIQAQVNVNGDKTPVCNFIYNKELDQLTYDSIICITDFSF